MVWVLKRDRLRTVWQSVGDYLSEPVNNVTNTVRLQRKYSRDRSESAIEISVKIQERQKANLYKRISNAQAYSKYSVTVHTQLISAVTPKWTSPHHTTALFIHTS